jgi:hypothetical protein
VYLSRAQLERAVSQGTRGAERLRRVLDADEELGRIRRAGRLDGHSGLARRHRANLRQLYNPFRQIYDPRDTV